MKKGDRVKYTYIHHLNSKSSTVITKYGTVIGFVNHKSNYLGEQLVRVQLDRNKSISRIPKWNLKLIAQNE